MAPLIQKLFKPKWQHAKAAVRLQAIENLDNQTVLQDLAHNDMELDVQLAALQKLTDLDILVGFFNHHKDALKSQALKQFLRQLLGFDQTSDQIKALANLNESERLMQIATYAPDDHLRQQALAQIQDENVLYAFIQSSPSAKARQLALQGIQTPEYLSYIQKSFKGKDKTLVRLAKEKRQEQMEAADKIAQQQAQISKTIEQAEHLASSAFHPTYAAQLAHLKQSWPKLIEPSEKQTSQFNQAIETAEQILAENQAQQAAIEAEKQTQETQRHIKETCISSLQETLNEIKQTSRVDLSAISATLKTEQHNWLKSQKQSQADKQSQAEFDALLKTLLQVENALTNQEHYKKDLDEAKQALERIDQQSYAKLQTLKKLLNKIQKACTWPDALPLPKSLQMVNQQFEKITVRLDKIKQNEKGLIEKINNQIKSLEQAIENGQIKEAKQLMRGLQDSLNAISDEKAREFQNRKHLLQGQLQELIDWQGFATLPKKDAFREEMEALIDSNKDPSTLADEINALQQEWKTLGGVNKKSSQPLWDRFKYAADKAYEPCRAHFHQQGEERRINKEKREHLCAQLETFLQQNDWDNADWKALPTLCDQAKEEWKQYSPVDRRDHKVLQERFNNILGKIRNKLNEEHTRNAEQKKALIDQVAALIDAEELSSAIEECKALQVQWKTIPQAGRKDFALWKTFREQCDALFNRRDEEKNQRQAVIDSTIEMANQLFNQAQADISASSSINEKNTNLDNARKAFSELHLPKRVFERIRNQFSDLEKAIRHQAETAKQSEVRQLWQNARYISQLLAEAEQTGETNQEIDQALEKHPLPSEVRAILSHRSAQLQTAQVQPSETLTLQNLCLELEITMGLDSPDTDKDQRMALQVNLLQSRMGQAQQPRQQQLSELQLKWFEQTGKNETYPSYCKRFFDGINRC